MHARALVLLIAAAAVAIRLGYVWAHASRMFFTTWHDLDPDTYGSTARALADGSLPWSFSALEHTSGFVRAPLYTVVLWVVASAADHARVAAALHALLGAGTVVGAFLVGRALHSTRAGLITAAIQACWLPSIVSVTSFYQEQLAVPLATLGLGLVLDGAYAGRRRRLAAGAGALALAALTRSLTWYLALAAALVCLPLVKDRRIRLRLAAGLAAAVLLTLPYVVFVSRAMGQVVIVENMGFFHAPMNDPPGRPIADSTTAPMGLRNAPVILFEQFAAAPAELARKLLGRVRGLMRPLSTWFLPAMTIAPDEAAATRLKAAVHAAGDVPFFAVWFLAPFGILAARRREASTLVAFWMAAGMMLVAVAGVTGPRFRAPLDPLAAALAACALAGGAPRADRRLKAAGVLAAGLIGAALLHYLPGMIRARSDVGVEPWTRHADETGRRTRTGRYAAFSAMPQEGRIVLTVRCERLATDAALTLDGKPLASLSADACAAGRRVVIPATPRRFVRLAVHGGGAPLEITVWDEPTPTHLMLARGAVERRAQTPCEASARRRTPLLRESRRDTARRILPRAAARPSASPS